MQWAALLCEHGAASVDLVHRHPVPEFAPADWQFADAHIAATLANPGWWRQLPADRQQAIGTKFWQAGRLTLEPWLPHPARCRPGTCTCRPSSVRSRNANGFPALDEHFTTSLAGLHITGFTATQDFGFVRGAPAAASIIIDALAGRTA